MYVRAGKSTVYKYCTQKSTLLIECHLFYSPFKLCCLIELAWYTELTETFQWKLFVPIWSIWAHRSKFCQSVPGDDDLKTVFDVGLVSSPLKVLYHEERAHLCFPTVVRWESSFQREIKVHLSFITTQMNSAFLPRQRERERERNLSAQKPRPSSSLQN